MKLAVVLILCVHRRPCGTQDRLSSKRDDEQWEVTSRTIGFDHTCAYLSSPLGSKLTVSVLQYTCRTLLPSWRTLVVFT